ncbi:YqeG family HAD IIIA-type phosphatase [Pseudothermotoga sp.]|uniref:YqeG family HAD IIIA-type phosphatase n=1 Tax=Pseudothermotoga sp. TaxID=2033661 RepID=UPI0031F6749C
MGLFDLFKPNEFVDDLKQLSIEKYLSSGKDVFIFDFDNTLGLWRNAEIKDEFKALLESLKLKGAEVLIVSNGRPRRVMNLDGFNIVWRAGKPFSKRLKNVFKRFDPSRVVLIGDQIFTDVVTGKRFGFYTIKVKPLSEEEFFGTKILRFFEKILLKILRGKTENEM